MMVYIKTFCYIVNNNVFLTRAGLKTCLEDLAQQPWLQDVRFHCHKWDNQDCVTEKLTRIGLWSDKMLPLGWRNELVT